MPVDILIDPSDEVDQQTKELLYNLIHDLSVMYPNSKMKADIWSEHYQTIDLLYKLLMTESEKHLNRQRSKPKTSRPRMIIQ